MRVLKMLKLAAAMMIKMTIALQAQVIKEIHCSVFQSEIYN